MKSIPSRKNIYVALNAAYEHQRAIQRGILRYALAQPSWRLLNIAHEGELGHEFMRLRQVDGVIGNFSEIDVEHESLQLVQRRGISAVVGVSARAASAPVPRVVSDDAAAGAMAAQFFLQRQFRHFAFYAGGMQPPHHAAVLRGQAFEQFLRQAGRDCLQLQSKDLYGSDFSLPRSCGIFVFNTHEARVLLEALLLRDVLIPEDVAILGVDHEPWQQQLSPLRFRL
ncbi:MAG: substrate-binding domain-containing protein [Verrucomicrobia bacterium]|nr:substrate-binding domain-containing protein [Verrucomicrobiota bacterium]